MSRSISAASVMAAGSVMNEPSRGTKASTRKYMAMPLGRGMQRESKRTSAPAKSRMGRVPAITMMAKTNMGAVKLRESR
ncbi:hypothetical protein D3C80_2097190 [compost metagenome]